jgi:5-methyltetrahydrofolate--homocysteine methyltransferase
MNITFLDGAFGTMLQSRGLKPGETPEDWNITHPESVREIHREYLASGADIINANTFGANSLKYHGAYRIEEIISAGIGIAREACDGFDSKKVALDIGPTGRLLKPTGELDFERAYDAFAESVRYGVKAKADLILIETFGDAMELKAAILAAKENSNLPIYATVALSEDGKLLTGADIECIGTLFETLGVDVCGFNCGLGPDKLIPYVEKLSHITHLPIAVKANAGMPKVVNGKTIFTVGAEEFAQNAARLVDAGASFIGGCCGTTPKHIAAVKSVLANREISRSVPIERTIISSGCSSVELKSGEGIIIGERINPTGKKKLKEAYINGDTAYVLREAVTQVDAGAKILDVNCGVPGIDEADVLDSTVIAVQGVTTVPLQIDTADANALQRALRHVNGKALVNSVNGKQESMDNIFPLVKKYGGTIVALCLDESGIPETSQGRIEIAKKILTEGKKYGFKEKDFVFDALTLAVSADPNAAIVTLETVKRLTEELNVNTVLGVSNVSFGLPNRPRLNNAMYTLACQAGLSCAIANPSAISLCDDEEAFDVLLGRDKNCEHWIEANQQATPTVVTTENLADDISSLRLSIKRGLKDDAKSYASKLLNSGNDAMSVIQNGIVPSLEEVGSNFESGKVFLPQLLMSADAAGAAFESVKSAMRATSNTPASKGNPIVIATVKGDIHDIGKNIVRALLENYGFDVIDLGRDVAPEKIVEAVKKSNAMMVGLSALMTTTVGAMAETIALLRKEELSCKICVGGAVVTQDYADEIGADFYGKDAMCTVRFAESLLK